MTVSGMKSTVIDLDAMRAARDEAEGSTVTIMLGGQGYEVPREIPFAVLQRARDNDLDGALAALMGNDEAARFMASPALRVQDIAAMLEAIIADSTGSSLGESSGSSTSSRRTTKR